MWLVLLTQSLLLVAIVAWLAAAPPASWPGLTVQVVASLFALLALARIGLWLFPPWWVPLAGIVSVVVISAWLVMRRPRSRRVPNGALAWLHLAFFAALAAGSAIVVAKGTASGAVPTGTVDLTLPFESGRYLVVNGGSWVVGNAHRQSVGSSDPKFIPWRGNGWAVDLIAIDRWGLRTRGILPADPARYHIFGRPVIAPCEGDVVVAEDGRPDMHVPEYDRPKIAGNHLIIDCGGLHVVLAHLRKGSILVRKGDHLRVRQPIGQVTNSGGSSEPHLHIHAQRPGPPEFPIGGDPIPIRLDGRFLVRGDRVAPRLDWHRP